MCEEIKDASTVVLRAMMLSMVVNGTLGLAMLLAILLCIGNIEDALSTPTRFPFIEIFAQATKSTQGATAMTSLIASLTVFAIIA